MTSRVGCGTRRRERHVKPSRGPIFRADRKAAQLRRQAWNFTGGRRRRWRQTMRRTKDADLRRRYQIVWLWAEGFTKTAMAQMLCCHRNTVAKVLQAFQDKGELGLVDGRVANGPTKVTPAFVGQVKQLIAGSPDPKWNHATWTEELLTLVLTEQTGIEVSVSTMCRVLKRLQARKGRPRPVVRCPWPAWKRQRRLRDIRKLIETLPADEIALFEDEVDIHLNPKIGPDWMLPGTQKEVLTPGQNQKRYIAGAILGWGKDLLWVSGPSKRSTLFLLLVDQLWERFQSYQLLHLIVDNYIIPTSQITRQAVAAKKGKVQLHFLPPYCPQHNPIERLWRDLHANITRNHRCQSIDELMAQVTRFLDNIWADCQEDSSVAA